MDPLPHVQASPLDYRAIASSPVSRKWAQLLTRDRDAETPYLLLGAPFDSGIPTRPGARFGPATIREQWAKLGLWSPGVTWQLEDPLIRDLGDVESAGTHYLETHQRLHAAWTAALTAAPQAFPLMLGGDHSLTAPAFAAYQQFHGHQLGCLVFDAHLDVREWSQTNISSGTPFRRILEMGPQAIAGRNLVYLGIRPFANAPAHMTWAGEQGATIYTMATIRERGLGVVLTEALEIASEGTEGVWCSVDIDVVDQGDAPGASATGPGGMRNGELIDALEVLGGSGRVVALDVMEVSPPCDFQEMTSRLAAHLLATFIAARLR